MASRVILINEGRLVYDGPLDDLDPTNKGLDQVFADLTGHGESDEVVEQDAGDSNGDNDADETLRESDAGSQTLDADE